MKMLRMIRISESQRKFLENRPGHNIVLLINTFKFYGRNFELLL